MPGRVIGIIPITKFEAAAGGTTTQTIAQQVDVSQSTEATMIIRYHGLPADFDGGNIAVSAYSDGHTMLDPATEFLEATAAETVTLSTGSAPLLKVAKITTGALGAMLTIKVVVTGGQSNPLEFDVSMDLALKSA